MTNVKFPRKELEKQIKLTKEVIEKIPLFGTPLEKVTDDEIEIEVFPNRPDLISMQGFIRSFKPYITKSPIKKYQIQKPKPNYKVKIEPSVNKVRPFTVCAIISDLKFDDEKIKEIIDLQEKLHNTTGRKRKKVAIGIYPLEKIKLPITYKALPPDKIKFIPLEETRELTGKQILSKHPTGREYAHLLENEEKFPVFIDANNKFLSMPPVINSHETGKVTEQTKEVFIECSGSHLETLNKTLNIIVTTLADMGGKINQMNLEYSNKKLTTPDLTPQKMKLSIENTNKLLGLNLKESDLTQLLAKMGIEYKNKTAFIPAWRTDILHEVDLIEDVAIAYGYDKFMPEIPQVSTIGQESKKEKIKSKISEVLIGLGLTEISSYHLIKPNETSEKNLLELEDSKTEYKILRPNLLISALRTFSQNKDNDYPQNIFEVGTVFSKDESKETGVNESTNLLIALSPANFTKIKQTLEALFSSLSLKAQLEESEHPDLIPGRTAKIALNDKPIGYLGELHPETLRDWTIKMPLAVLEISLDEIFKNL